MYYVPVASGTTTQSLVDAVLMANNPYDRSFSDTVTAQTVGYGFKNGLVAKWVATGTYNSINGITGGIWKLLSDQTKWLSPSFVTYANITNATGVAKNGLLYDNCEGGTIDWTNGSNYCTSKGMRLASTAEAGRIYSGWGGTQGVPACAMNTPTWTNEYTGSSNWYYAWNGDSSTTGLISNSSNGSSASYYIRCVR